jgi:ABC-type proline/glycine betaine transport system ATPase subunit
VLSFENVVVRVEGRNGPLLLVDGVSLSVPRGAITVVVGPSGSGKSTLLRLGNRLSDPTEGRVSCDGRDVREVPVLELRRRVGFVAQTPAMWGETVAETISYGPEIAGRPLGTADVEKLLMDVGLSAGYADKVPTELSGGEAQRVALARTLALGPTTLLLDEPSSALDPASRSGFEDLLVELVHSRGLAALLVTHDMEQAKRVGDRAALLSDGKIVATGPPSDVLNSSEAAELFAVKERTLRSN